jgi:hypothetical protein
VVAFAVAAERDHVPPRVEGGRVVADEGVRQVEGFAQECLVEEPGAAAEGAGGFAGHPGFEFLCRDAAERRDQDRQVGGLVPQGELDVGDRVVGDGVRGRVVRSGAVAVDLGAAAGGADEGRVRGRWHRLIEPFPQLGLTGGFEACFRVRFDRSGHGRLSRWNGA